MKKLKISDLYKLLKTSEEVEVVDSVYLKKDADNDLCFIHKGMYGDSLIAYIDPSSYRSEPAYAYTVLCHNLRFLHKYIELAKFMGNEPQIGQPNI